MEMTLKITRGMRCRMAVDNKEYYSELTNIVIHRNMLKYIKQQELPYMVVIKDKIVNKAVNVHCNVLSW